MNDIHFRYRTLTDESRKGWFGEIMRFVSAHPFLAGTLGGVIAVLIAGLQSLEGVRTAPGIAAILAGVVIVVWIVLFRLMRPFFTQQTKYRREVVREITASEHVFTWREEGQTLRHLVGPSYRIVAQPVKDEFKGNRERPWPVWLVVEHPVIESGRAEPRGGGEEGEAESNQPVPDWRDRDTESIAGDDAKRQARQIDSPFILATKVSAYEAGHYEQVQDTELPQADESLPTHIAGVLLNLAR